MQRNWVSRMHRTLAEAGQPLRAKQIAIRCGCVYENEYASLRHALRRELASGHLHQDAHGRYVNTRVNYPALKDEACSWLTRMRG